MPEYMGSIDSILEFAATVDPSRLVLPPTPGNTRRARQPSIEAIVQAVGHIEK